MWTGIPVYQFSEEESARLLRMEEELVKRIVGQDEAISSISKAVRRARAGSADSTTSAGSGMTSRASFALLSPDGSSWRTSQASFVGALNTFCGTWPLSGSMRSGTCFPRRKSARRTFGSDDRP